MKTTKPIRKTLLGLGVVSVFIAGCASAPKSPAGSANVRQQLTQLQTDAELAVLAPLAIKDAEQAVMLAEQAEKDAALAAHRVVMAERKVAMANAQAKTRQLELQRDALSQRRDEVRLNARTREANMARADATQSRADASDARSATEQAKQQAMLAANREQVALSAARTARLQAEEASQEAVDLRSELAELNARPSDRGLVVTLGDVLFDSGQASLKKGSNNHLDKLAQFLNTYPKRSVQIEGHTDDVGSESANMLLSQRRADSVKSFLVAQGIAGSRLGASGKGESAPLASNVTVDGRQQNRRVEVIIASAIE